MTDLIERLRAINTHLRGGYGTTQIWWGEVIDESITALTPVTSEEVQAECRHLRLEHEKRAADLIERLNRAYGGVRNDMKQASKIISEQEQRIEELEKESNEYAEIMAEHLIESDKHDAAMLQRAERAEQQRDAFEESAKQELFEDGFDDSGIDPKSYMQGRLDFIEEVRDRIRAMGGE